MSLRANLFGYGMLAAGYSAGIRMNGHDWTGIPWWGDAIFAIFAVFALTGAFVLWVRSESR